ncbi:MAG: hypothetical protein J5J00_11245 [Deltaproteobacteria bacterium]|nr:hypothetical protein [Deltaproteobacteria bacterium]
MYTLLDVILIIAALLIALRAAVFLFFIVALLKVRLKNSEVKIVSESDGREAIRGLAPVEQELYSLGFTAPFFINAGSPHIGNEPDHIAFFANTAQSTYAMVTMAGVMLPGEPLRVNFLTIFEDGSRVNTFNSLRHFLIGSEYGKWQDFYVPEISEQYRRHIESLSQGARKPVMSAAEATQDLYRWRDEYLALSAKDNRLKLHPSGDYTITLSHALATAWKQMAAAGKAARVNKLRLELLGGAGARSAQDEVSEYYQLHKQMEKGALSGRAKLWIFGVSLVLFILSFLNLLELTDLLILVAVISFHELGHIFGMWLFGYTNLNILFLPFLGAVATGKRQAPALHKEIVILLCGPLPGLTIGSWILFTGDSATPLIIKKTGLYLVALNAFNMLPIMPLDGGQIVHQLFGNSLIGSLIIKITGFLGLIALGVYAETPILTGIGAMLLTKCIIDLPLERAKFAIASALKGTPKSLSEREVLALIFETAKDTYLSKVAAARKHAVVQQLLQQLQMPKANIMQRTLLCACYLVALVSPVLIYMLR